MSRTLTCTTTRRYGKPFGATSRQQPLSFFLLENLLTARANSMFPTNGAGPDEDVNVYLAHLLTRFLTGDDDQRVGFAGSPLLTPPPKAASMRARAEFYRANADNRLLYLGLFGWGDGRRRRQALYNMSDAETHTRDLATGQSCYALAASHLRIRNASDRALAAIWEKLAAYFTDYVHVLGVVATRQLGLGAKLADNDLSRLVPPDKTTSAHTVADLLQAPPPVAAMDLLLDLWLEQQENPDPVTATRLQAMADQFGVALKSGSVIARGSAVAERDDLTE